MVFEGGMVPDGEDSVSVKVQDERGVHGDQSHDLPSDGITLW